MNGKRLYNGLLALALALAPGLVPGLAKAAYPDHPIKLIVPFSPGGNIDSTARIVAKGLSAYLHQPVVVENRPGAGGIVGEEYVAHAKPDGYTCLLASTGTLATQTAFYSNVPFDFHKAFVSAGAITRASLVLEVRDGIPSDNLKDFIAYAKAHPNLLMASSGIGTSNHMSGELFQGMAHVKFVHVPFKGSSDALTALMGGHADLMFDQLTSSLALIKAGKLHAIAVTSATRSAAMPNLPTISESGLKGYESSTTTGIVFPAGTPPEVITTINAALQKVLDQKDTQQTFLTLGVDTVPGSPEAYSTLLDNEEAKWLSVLKAAGIPRQKL